MDYPILHAGSFFTQLKNFYDPENKKTEQDFYSSEPALSIRALSWKEPYGTLMKFGKQETRTWSTEVRGYILICTSQKPYTDKQVKHISGNEQYEVIRTYFNSNPTYLSNGKAIAIGRLTGCRKFNLDDEEKTFVEYRNGLYVHAYQDVHPIVPFYWKGSQGFKKLYLHDIKKIQVI